MLIGYACIDTDRITEYAKEHPHWTGDHWQDYFYFHQKDIPVGETDGVGDPLSDSYDMKLFLGLAVHLVSVGQKFEVYTRDSFAAVIGYNGKRFVLPAELVTVEPLTDYTDIPAERLTAIGSGGMDLPAVPGSTQMSLREKADDVESQISLLNKEEKAIKDCTSADMTDLKAQLDALMKQINERQENLMAELKKKQDELAEKKKKLKKELFILETQIYGIRCYLGETASFYTVRGGDPAPKDAPVVIYQKIRFLDEELGKHLALFAYGSHEDDKEQLLNVLKYRDDIADLLCPGPKSISAVKLSRTGKVKGASETIANMLEDYDMYHENQLAVLIRNGEQIHISWLDADKISISDDSIFYRPKNAESEVIEEKKDIFYESRKEAEEKLAREEMLSRWFFFAVLQGVLDNTSLVSLPEKASVTDMNSPYIKFSLAEGWIASDMYGSFSDMLAKSKDIPLREGDVILTGMHIGREDRDQDRAWNNNRGIGEKNRTYGASLPSREFIRVNKVIPGLKVRYKVQRCRAHVEMDPEGNVMYWYKDGSGFSYPMERYEDQLERIERSPSYTVVRTDEVLGTVYVTETMSGNHWYGTWGVHSYRKLTDKQLISLSRIRRNKANRCDNDSSVDTAQEMKEAYEKGTALYYKKVTEAEILGEEDHQYYCSVENTASWSLGKMNVNFQFYEGEVIPMPFLCSSWVRSVIMSGNIGKFSMCSTTMGYTDMLPYLHKMLAYLKDREETEKEMLTAAGGAKWLDEHDDWDAVLCEWKIKNKIHALTETRAKRFLSQAVEHASRIHEEGG